MFSFTIGFREVFVLLHWKIINFRGYIVTMNSFECVFLCIIGANIFWQVAGVGLVYDCLRCDDAVLLLQKSELVFKVFLLCN